MESTKLSRVAKKLFSNIEFDEEEKLLYEIRKHPFGLFIIYVTGFFVSAVIFIALVFGSVALKDDSLGLGAQSGALQTGMIILGAILTLLALGATAVGAYLYESNVVIVTSEKIAQVLYRNIFDRKISQLSVGDVQDVTVSQKGLFARLFNYGTLVIETAGEQSNYTFTFTPNPYQAAKIIVGSHEQNLKQYGN